MDRFESKGMLLRGGSAEVETDKGHAGLGAFGLPRMPTEILRMIGGNLGAADVVSLGHSSRGLKRELHSQIGRAKGALEIFPDVANYVDTEIRDIARDMRNRMGDGSFPKQPIIRDAVELLRKKEELRLPLLHHDRRDDRLQGTGRIRPFAETYTRYHLGVLGAGPYKPDTHGTVGVLPRPKRQRPR